MDDQHSYHNIIDVLTNFERFRHPFYKLALKIVRKCEYPQEEEITRKDTAIVHETLQKSKAQATTLLPRYPFIGHVF